MDWGFGQAVSKLYTGTSATERNKNEMATIGLMENQYVKENAEKDAAQLKQQTYDKEVQDFANKLLGPDRNKINQRAKILQSKVRDQIKFYGGDMTRFFANGGGKVMDDYRSGVVNSVEATEYMENQKNAFQLAYAQIKGMGGQINPNDLQSLKDYNENGGGKITYSGLLNKITMPDAGSYQIETEIPAEDIYMLNKFAIDGDFIAVMGRPPADKLEALNYIKLHHGAKGSNSENQEKIRANQLGWAKEGNDKIKNDQDYQVAMAKIAASGGRKTKTVDGPNGSVEVYDDEQGGMVTPNNTDYKGQAGYKASLASKTMNAIATVGNDIAAGDFFTGMKNNKEGLSKLEQVSVAADAKPITFYDQSLREKKTIYDFSNSDDKNGVINEFGQWVAGNKQYTLMNARKLYQGKESVVAKGLLNITDDKQIDLSTGTLHDWQPDDSFYRSNGSKNADNPDPIDHDEYNGEWKIQGIYMGGLGKSRKGKDSLVMNLMDNDKVAENNGKNYQEMYSNSTIRPVQVVVLTNDAGDVFYKALDNNQYTANYIHNALKEDDDPSAISTAAYQENNVSKSNKAANDESKKDLDVFWKTNIKDPFTTKTIQLQLAILNPGAITNKRDSLVKAFYGMIAYNNGAYNTKDYASFVTEQKRNFITYARHAEDEGFKIKVNNKELRFRDALNSSLNNIELIDRIIKWSEDNGQSDQIPMLQQWRENLQVVEKYGAQ